MKRLLSLLLAFVLVIPLCSCGKSDAAQAVDDMISSLEVVDENSRAAIEEVETAYDALSDKEKQSLDNYMHLEEMRSAFDELMANQAITAISWIGAVTENSWNDIQNARQIYSSLTDAQQKLVSNYSDLTAAEEQYINIKVGPVEDMIAQIPSFDATGDTLPEGFADAVETANEAYEKLDETLRSEVSNHEELEAATQYLSDYRVNSLIVYIDENLTEVDFNSGVNLIVANTAYDMLSDDEKARITNYDVLTAAQEKFDSLTPIQIDSYTLKKDIIGNPTISISVTNMTDSIVKEFTMNIFSYDSDGVPVKVYFNDFSHGVRWSDALRAGTTAKSDGYWQLYGDYNEMKQFVVILRSVEFYDGTTWQNPQYSTLYDKYNEKILSAGDENVLPRV